MVGTGISILTLGLVWETTAALLHIYVSRRKVQGPEVLYFQYLQITNLMRKIINTFGDIRV